MCLFFVFLEVDKGGNRVLLEWNFLHVNLLKVLGNDQKLLVKQLQKEFINLLPKYTEKLEECPKIKSIKSISHTSECSKTKGIARFINY